MKSILLGVASLLKPPVIPNGQIHYTAVGTYEWTCPEGVTKVSLAMMGAGGSSTHGANANASARWVGNGGNLRYKNDIPVVPGQKYTIIVPGPIQRYSNPAQAFGISSNDPLSDTLLGADGTTLPVTTTVGNVAFGCNAGGAPAGQNGIGFNLLTFQQNTATQSGWTTTNRIGNLHGGGAGIYNGGGKYPYFGAAGAIGSVRLIWGNDRAFPDKNIGNL